MKIHYDHQIFNKQRFGGISRYFFELINRFDGINNSASIGICISNNAYLNSKSHSSVFPFFEGTSFKGKGTFINKSNEIKNRMHIKHKNFDIFHPTYYDDYFLKKIGNKPFVVTFYDMIHEKFSEQFEIFRNENSTINKKRILAEKANKIIAISESTKKDIVELYGINESKIDVVYLGNSLQIDHSLQFNDVNIYGEYILFVGTRDLYKNFIPWIKVAAELIKMNNLKLVCAGGEHFSQDEFTIFKELEIEQQVIHVKFKSDMDLANLYRNALFFVFPSLYEGFGIPVLESFASSCPILLSNQGSLPEVGGDAACYFDPSDEESIFQSTKLLIDNLDLRKELVKKGMDRLKYFSWEKTFSETLTVYDSLL